MLESQRNALRWSGRRQILVKDLRGGLLAVYMECRDTYHTVIVHNRMSQEDCRYATPGTKLHLNPPPYIDLVCITVIFRSTYQRKRVPIGIIGRFVDGGASRYILLRALVGTVSS